MKPPRRQKVSVYGAEKQEMAVVLFRTSPEGEMGYEIFGVVLARPKRHEHGWIKGQHGNNKQLSQNARRRCLGR